MKITFLGAGSTIFAKNILGDCLLTEALQNAEYALYDIHPDRLDDSRLMLETLNRNLNHNRATIRTYLHPSRRREALAGADFIINAIQVGGYEPCTVTDFEIPKRYNLRQTIGDTLGIGGIFRALRTIPVLLEFTADIEAVCPQAWLLNYTNPMSILTGALLMATRVKTVGLCHSVQVCANDLLNDLGMLDSVNDLKWKIAGINHMAWLLEISDGQRDLYPEIKQRALEKNRLALAAGNPKHPDMVRYELMKHFGYYITESSEHNAEYSPYWIKAQYPELITDYNIPLDEYPRRCIDQIDQWNRQKQDLVNNGELSHTRTLEYGASIIEAIVTGKPYQIGGNVLNHGLIPNLPDRAIVEVPCLVDGNGVQGCYAGPLPEQCAALNRTNINVHLLTLEAALKHKREAIYHAAMLDPHTAAELTLDQIRSLCDELIAAHGDWLPEYG